MILREVVQDCFVDLAVPKYRLVLFEAKTPQPAQTSPLVPEPAIWGSGRTLALNEAQSPKFIEHRDRSWRIAWNRG
jgi:hypothetical protein